MVKPTKVKKSAAKSLPGSRAKRPGGDPVAEQGSGAAKAGLCVSACPYEPGSDLAERWAAGYALVG